MAKNSADNRSKRSCQYCGTDISHRAGQARNCSISCKALFSKAVREGTVDQVPARQQADNVVLLAAPRPRNARTRGQGAPDDDNMAQPAPPSTNPALNVGTKTYDDTLAALTKADRLSDPMAGATLKLAARIDSSAMDTGSSLAAMVKQLELALVAVMKDVRAEADPVDELRRIREEKRAQALSS